MSPSRSSAARSEAVVLWSLGPGGGRDVVEAVDPDAVGWDLVVAVEVGELPALDEDLVVLVEVEAEQWALELGEDWLAIAAHPDMGQALVNS